MDTSSLEDYILSHIDAEGDELARLNRDSHLYLVNPRMVSGHLQGRILKMFCRMVQPHRVLELGTLTGYSALCLAEGLPEGGVVHTIEHNDELENFIRQALAQSPYGSRVMLHIGDALDIIPQLQEKWDMVFIDADKRQYKEYYETVLPHVRQGGFILADNTLWDGHVVEKLKTGDKQTKSILEFNDFVAKDPRIEKVILPLRDGLTIMMKK